jgi:hypothetical protein
MHLRIGVFTRFSALGCLHASSTPVQVAADASGKAAVSKRLNLGLVLEGGGALG